MKNILKYFVLAIVTVSFSLLICSCSGFSDSDFSEKSTIDCSSEAEIKSDNNNGSTVDSSEKNDGLEGSLDSTFSGEDNLSEDGSVITSEQQDPPTSDYTPPKEEDATPAVPTDERDYEIMYNYELDKCYIVFYDSTPYEVPIGGVIEASLRFSSIEDFLYRVLNGKLKSYEKHRLANVFQNDKIGFEICDLKNLYYPVMPDSVVTSEFDWYGKHYSFSMEEESGEYVGHLTVYDEEALNELYERTYVNTSYKDVVSKVIDGTDIVGKYFYSKGTLAKLQYELKTEERTVYVQKNYFSDNPTVPKYVELFCTEGDKYYYVSLYVGFRGLEEDLDNDWLLSFSLESYVG